jgi:hypothetical protein
MDEEGKIAWSQVKEAFYKVVKRQQIAKFMECKLSHLEVYLLFQVTGRTLSECDCNFKDNALMAR